MAEMRKQQKRKALKRGRALAVTRLDRKLLKPGWAGQLSDDEIEFIRQELKRSSQLWRSWGYKRSLLRGVSIPATTIRRVALHGL
jgi:hypothetical protein